jgi:hypothetical protein
MQLLLLNIISLIPHNLMIKYKLRKLHPMLKQKSSRCPYRQASQVTAFKGSFGGSPFGGSLGGSGSDGDLVIGSCLLGRAMATGRAMAAKTTENNYGLIVRKTARMCKDKTYRAEEFPRHRRFSRSHLFEHTAFMVRKTLVEVKLIF